MAKDYYDLLGVPRDANEQDLKKAYRKLAMELHPDRNPGNKEAEAKFKEVNEAYEVLKDPRKRPLYDQFGHAGVNQGAGGGGPGGFPGGGFPGGGGGGFGDIFDNLEDIFGDIFGGAGGGGRGGRGRSGALRGEDLRYDLTITLEDVMAGKEVRLRVPTILACDTCNGSGARPGSGPETCAHCGGTGEQRTQQGFFAISRPCPTCRGQGRVIRNPCPDCRGDGRKRGEKNLTVKIPPGVDAGTRIRLSNEGGAGMHGGPPGDLYIILDVSPHGMFERHGPDLLCHIPITFPQATLGGKLEIPTLNGRARISIPEGTQNGKRFVLRGKGLPHLNRPGIFGDLVAEMRVETPVNLTKRQRELLEEFQRLSGDDSQPESSTFMGKVKDFFDKMSA
ncbi:MAG: molecular chaperone DnaJ [Magnetococcales bacterium]|nr:molecular chaperone DnaJ [Magnetococcales bacterium]